MKEEEPLPSFLCFLKATFQALPPTNRKSPPPRNRRSSSLLIPDCSPHHCLLCGEIIQTLSNPAQKARGRRKKTNVKTKGSTSSFTDNDTALSMLRFISVDCLGFDVTMEQMEADLAEVSTSGNPVTTQIELFLCEGHIKFVAEGLKLEKLVQETISKLEIIKKTVKEGMIRNYPSSFNATELCKLEYGYDVKVKTEEDEQPIIPLEEEESEITIDRSIVDDVDFDFCEIDPFSDISRPQSFFGEQNDAYQKDIDPVGNQIVSFKDSPTGRITRSRKINNEINSTSEEGVLQPKLEEIEDDAQFIFIDSPSPNPSGDSYAEDWDELPPIKKRKRIAQKSTRNRSRKTKMNVTEVRRMRNWKRKIKCEICKQEFATAKERKAHRSTVHADIPPPIPDIFPCPLCEKVYKNKYELANHTQRVHSTNEPTFTCNECPAVYMIYADLRHHKLRRHTANAKKIITCPYCTTGKRYKGEINLSAHIRVQHKEGNALPKKHLVCEFCGKVYSNATDFKKHKLKVHLNAYAASICDVCGKKLSDPSSLKKHKLSQHQKSFQYKCELCGSGSLFKSHLIAHYKQTHPHLTEDELDGFIKNCTKVIDNTNPIYRQDEVSISSCMEISASSSSNILSITESTLKSVNEDGHQSHQQQSNENFHCSHVDSDKSSNNTAGFVELINCIQL
ncbi:GDNF-inducible zinc finger protein 1 [Folsomia candida]|uniref:C2H2-type domain-containing protein n=1 Tax=Folsomia candida TaxID=158441 RepID=A0A226EKH4_FOLCA|nr:GDNF-inducible zinc finger protein 1 [Folsomia candida]OXA58142.1 hypothetical protein Fcan01_06818 [Folsomia candida]